MVQINPHAIHPDRCSPAQITVDGFRIERFSLPGFQLVDGRAGIKVATSQPSMFAAPLNSLFRILLR
jgi:hypothetical protein